MNLAPKAEEFATAEMAEDPRYRGKDPFARPQGAGSASGGDPLAELARLIGQNDPFADLNRDPRGADPRAAGARAAVDQRQPGTAPSVDWRSSPSPDPFRSQPSAPPAYTDPYAGHGAAHASHQAGHVPGLNPGRGAPPAQHAPEPHYNGQPYAGAPGHPAAQAGAYPQGYDPAAYGQQPGYEQEAYEADPYYQEDQPQDGMYPAYEEAGAPRRRGGILTMLAVLALAIVGIAGAFGYRAVFGNAGSPVTPPVIRADGAPTKVVPATQAGEPQSNKLIYDRVGDRNQGEKIMAREEQPVEIREPAPPRVMFPGPANVAPQVAMPANASALAPVTSAPPGVSEPKKVKTVTIRSDGTPAAPAPAAPAPARNQQAAAAPPAMPEPMAPAPRAPRGQPAPSANAPLSLSAPGTAPTPPAPRATAPSRVASAAVESGAYVQVSSQRSEAEAHSSFRSLQAKFPNILGGRQAVIRRADLGDKGTYYRAQVGPFGSASDANQLCESLRAAGGQCVVQRN